MPVKKGIKVFIAQVSARKRQTSKNRVFVFQADFYSRKKQEFMA
jgi:hypothetical protein